jgi:DNA-directed RNA polymerase subunit RPC12/RpoP
MFTCGTCWRQFPAGWQSRQQHMNATGHEAPEFECKTCDRYFSSQKAVQQHMNHLDHWDESSESEYIVYGCDHCDDEFDDEDELHDHEARDHFYCVVCSRTFQDLHSITQHLRGKVHRITTVQCPFCKDSQGTATGLAYHLERGCCSKAPLNRHKLYAAIRQRDPGGIICNRLLTWSGTVTYAATEKAWNVEAEAYECYLCHRLFGKLGSLNQHLGSLIHQSKLYHYLGASCRKDFTALAAMINHLESESCGCMRFDVVQKRVQYIVDPRRMIQA